MYNKKELFKKLKGHFNGDMDFLNALISDVEEFNSLCMDKQIELYIDYDNKSECTEVDTYETFSLKDLVKLTFNLIKQSPVPQENIKMAKESYYSKVKTYYKN